MTTITEKLLSTAVGKRLLRDAEREEREARDARRAVVAKERAAEVKRAETAAPAQAARRQAALDTVQAARDALQQAERACQQEIGEIRSEGLRHDRERETRERELREIAPPSIATFKDECRAGQEQTRHALQTWEEPGGWSPGRGNVTIRRSNLGEITTALAALHDFAESASALVFEPLTEQAIEKRLAKMRDEFPEIAQPVVRS